MEFSFRLLKTFLQHLSLGDVPGKKGKSRLSILHRLNHGDSSKKPPTASNDFQGILESYGAASYPHLLEGFENLFRHFLWNDLLDLSSEKLLTGKFQEVFIFRPGIEVTTFGIELENNLVHGADKLLKPLFAPDQPFFGSFLLCNIFDDASKTHWLASLALSPK